MAKLILTEDNGTVREFDETVAETVPETTALLVDEQAAPTE
jgi:hypothetical protein